MCPVCDNSRDEGYAVSRESEEQARFKGSPVDGRFVCGYKGNPGKGQPPCGIEWVVWRYQNKGKSKGELKGYSKGDKGGVPKGGKGDETFPGKGQLAEKGHKGEDGKGPPPDWKGGGHKGDGYKGDGYKGDYYKGSKGDGYESWKGDGGYGDYSKGKGKAYGGEWHSSSWDDGYQADLGGQEPWSYGSAPSSSWINYNPTSKSQGKGKW